MLPFLSSLSAQLSQLIVLCMKRASTSISTRSATVEYSGTVTRVWSLNKRQYKSNMGSVGGKKGRISRKGLRLFFSGLGRVSKPTKRGWAIIGLLAMIGVKSIDVMILVLARSGMTCAND